MNHSSDENTMSRGVLAQLGLVAAPRDVLVRDVGGASAQGRRRRRNEDAWGFRGATAFVVADGMGGRPAGDRAAHVAVDALLDNLTETVTDWRIPVGRANDAVQAARLTGDDPGGAVIVALRCIADRASILHVGDARAYRIRDGQAEPLTRDHSVAEAINDAGLHRSESGLQPRELSAVTSFLAHDDAWREYSVRELTVRPGDRLVLTTDGVHNHVSGATWGMLAEIDAAGDAAEFLVGTAQAAGSNDDATAVVVDLDLRLVTTTDDDA